jgi:hypothetical protein
MKHIILYVVGILLLSLIIVVLTNTGWCYFFDDDTVEMSRRITCESNQKKLYLAIENYNNKYGQMPQDLPILVDEGLVLEQDIYCPPLPRSTEMLRYIYVPDNYGNPEKIIISDMANNHGCKKLRLKKLKPIIIETMGDGNMVSREYLAPIE